MKFLKIYQYFQNGLGNIAARIQGVFQVVSVYTFGDFTFAKVNYFCKH